VLGAIALYGVALLLLGVRPAGWLQSKP
jgi:putative peptidoglycan lipid II flippase